jgi:RND family efflux transporter MFP subunit
MTIQAPASHTAALEALRIARPPVTKRRRSSLALIAIVALIICVAGAASFSVYSRAIGRPMTVQTITVLAPRSRRAGVVLSGSGYVVTRHKYITIGTKILGQIVAEPIEEGQHVKVGDLLARIEDRDYQAQFRQAIAIRDVAAANLRLKLSKLDRMRKLKGTGGISADDYDSAENAAQVAQAELQRDAAAVDYAKFQVDQCTITSPINGVVLKKYRELGDTINYGGEVQAGGGATDIVQLADTDDMRAEVDINEADIAKVSLGSRATVIPDAYSDRHFDATLVKIYPEADRQKGTVKVEVRIANPDLQVVKPEMSVKVSFLDATPTSTEASTIIIPKSAVRSDQHGDFVWTVHDGIARHTTIERGRETEAGTEISDGLKDGDLVVISSPTGLSDGRWVVEGN